jgi:hypothetical protein
MRRELEPSRAPMRLSGHLDGAPSGADCEGHTVTTNPRYSARALAITARIAAC